MDVDMVLILPKQQQHGLSNIIILSLPIERGNLSPVGHDLYETDDTNGKRKGTSKTISVACINQNEFEISNGRE
ncbi:hypothetical protein BLOT_004144 [Blomia tropicalis]|nr:hypothetical protein BLOT_004144 [Blomia tropicalis]